MKSAENSQNSTVKFSHYEIFGIAKLLKAVQLTFLISTLIKLLRNYGFVVLKLSVIIMILFAIFIKFKL